MLLFANSSDYLKYLSAFGKEPQDELSVGIFLSEGYAHMAVVEQEIWRMESTLAYVLTNYILCDSAFPSWLRMGLALHFSELYDQGEKMTEIQRAEALARERREFWVRRSLQGFWSGDDFADPAARERCEDLALSLTRVVLDASTSVEALLDAVHWKDAGFVAVRANTGRELVEFASSLLGEGEWGFEPSVGWGDEAAG